MEAQPPLPLLPSTVISLELPYCSGIAVLTRGFANKQTDVMSILEERTRRQYVCVCVRERERERESEFEFECVCVCV